MRTGAILSVAALTVLAACSKPADPVSVENSAEATADNLEDLANRLEAMAADQTNAAVAAELSDAAARFDNGADGLDNASGAGD